MGAVYVVFSGKYYEVRRNGAQEFFKTFSLAWTAVKMMQGDASWLSREVFIRQEVDIVAFLYHPLDQRFRQSVACSNIDNFHVLSFLHII